MTSNIDTLDHRAIVLALDTLIHGHWTAYRRYQRLSATQPGWEFMVESLRHDLRTLLFLRRMGKRYKLPAVSSESGG